MLSMPRLRCSVFPACPSYPSLSPGVQGGAGLGGTGMGLGGGREWVGFTVVEGGVRVAFGRLKRLYLLQVILQPLQHGFQLGYLLLQVARRVTAEKVKEVDSIQEAS